MQMVTDDVIHSNQYFIRQRDRQTNCFNTVSLRLKKMVSNTITKISWYITYINEAISVNLEHRPLVLGELLVLQETQPWLTAIKKNMFPWQLTFSSPYAHDLNMLVIFRSKNIKRGRELEQNIFICFLDHAYEAP